MGGFVTKVAKVGIMDRSRGLSMNRGVFIEAPKDFFLRYGDDFEDPNPKKPFDERVNVKVRYETWNGRVVPQTAEEKQKIDEAVAANEAKAASDAEAEASQKAAAASKKASGMGTDAGVKPRRRRE